MNYLAGKIAFHAPRPLVHFPPEGGLFGDRQEPRLCWDELCEELWRDHGVAAAVLPCKEPKCAALYFHGARQGPHLLKPAAGAGAQGQHAREGRKRPTQPLPVWPCACGGL
jgi:hypothetical protein